MKKLTILLVLVFNFINAQNTNEIAALESKNKLKMWKIKLVSKIKMFPPKRVKVMMTNPEFC